MSDPKYINKGFINLTAKIKDKEEDEGREIGFNLIVDKDKFDKLKPEEQKEILQQDLTKVHQHKVSGIYNMNLSFSYAEKDVLEGFDYGNIFVEAHIPYCLALPSGYDFEVGLVEEGGVLITPQKVWTHRAMSDGKCSDEIDFYADDEVLHFKTSSIITPKIPVNPEEGWQHNYTGNNLQKIKDRDGNFRFTQLYMQLKLEVTKEDLEDKDKVENILLDVKNKTLEAVNKLIDSYRFVTKEEYVTRLSDLSVNMIYFKELDEGRHILHPDIESATMNRSKVEIEKIRDMLSAGNKPDLYELLLLDAQNSFEHNNNVLAVVQSFQSLEIFIENFIIEKISTTRSITTSESENYITQGNNWKTKVRLKDLLKEVSGSTLEAFDKQLWDLWCTNYDTVRNEVIHKGKDISSKKVEETLKANVQVIDLLKTV